MNENNNGFEQEYDSLKDIIEYQNNMFNPGHYIGTGKVRPTVSAPGNATPLVVACFVAAAIFCALGLFSFFSDTHITLGLMESPIANKIITLITMSGISLLFVMLGLGYLRKAKRYYKQKAVMESEQVDKTVKDEIWQRICPKCGKSHDIDSPKCPYCKYNYLK